MAHPNYESLSAPQKAVIDAAVELRAAEANFKLPSGSRQADPNGGSADAHAQNRLRCAQVTFRHALDAYNAL